MLQLLFYTLQVFSTPALTGEFLLGSKCQQVSRTLLSILADLCSALVRKILILPLISNSPVSFSGLWVPFQYHYHFTLSEFFTPALADGFFLYWSLSENKYPQVSRTLLSILADLNNAVVWMVSTCPLTSKSSSPLTNFGGIVPSVLMLGKQTLRPTGTKGSKRKTRTNNTLLSVITFKIDNKKKERTCKYNFFLLKTMSTI